MEFEKNWDHLYDSGRDELWKTDQSLEYLADYLPDDAPRTLIDLGCGTSTLLGQSEDLGFFSVGIDISMSALKNHKNNSPNSHLIQGDVTSLALSESTEFGIVNCSKILGFVEHAKFLDLTKSLLHSSGVIIVLNEIADEDSPRLQKGAVTKKYIDEFTDNFVEEKRIYRNGFATFVGRLSD